MSNGRNVAHLLECLRHFGDPAKRRRYLELYVDSIVLHGYGLAPGIAAVRAHYEALWAAFPDVQIRTDEVFEAGDKVVSRFAVLGTHTGPFRGIAATGRHIQYDGITILRFAKGRCIERWSQTDRLSLMQQLGRI